MGYALVTWQTYDGRKAIPTEKADSAAISEAIKIAIAGGADVISRSLRLIVESHIGQCRDRDWDRAFKNTVDPKAKSKGGRKRAAKSL